MVLVVLGRKVDGSVLEVIMEEVMEMVVVVTEVAVVADLAQQPRASSVGFLVHLLLSSQDQEAT